LNEEIAEIKLIADDQLPTFDFGRLELTSAVVSTWLQNAQYRVEQ
jgi:hypothetical protein